MLSSCFLYRQKSFIFSNYFKLCLKLIYKIFLLLHVRCWGLRPFQRCFIYSHTGFLQFSTDLDQWVRILECSQLLWLILLRKTRYKVSHCMQWRHISENSQSFVPSRVVCYIIWREILNSSRYRLAKMRVFEFFEKILEPKATVL